jgi:ubiquinone/menaquinone biosynthesis C-methylase UbiE
MEDKECTIEDCDIFDFMAHHVGMTVIHPGGLRATQRLSESCNIDKNKRVLDIACGKGTTAVYLALKYGCPVVGIDISENLISESIALSRRKGLEHLVSFQVADALDLPFSDNEFDVAIGQAMLILVTDKNEAVEEALRVTKPGGHVGWLELSWKEQPTKEFMDGVSNVLCAYCMQNVLTFEDWQELFRKAGVKHFETVASNLEFQGMRGMMRDEGFLTVSKIMFRYLMKSRVRKRMKTMNRFFRENNQYFGFGIYFGNK